MLGLLWFDDGPRRSPQEKAAAARRYAERFGRLPAICYVHPSALSGSAISPDVGGVSLRVETRRSVLRRFLCWRESK